MRPALFRVFLWLLAGLSAVTVASAQGGALPRGPADVYFLAVGMANPQEEDFPAIRAARDSAEVVANALLDAGARHGILLTSDPDEGTMVSREDFLEALQALKERIRTDQPAAPRIVLYIMSHGIGDAANTSTYLIPDTLVFDQPVVQQEYSFRLARRTIWASDLMISLAVYRKDRQLGQLDGILLSDLLSESLGFDSITSFVRRLQELEDRLVESLEGLDNSQVDGRPVPFVLLLDNCNLGIDLNLFEPGIFTRNLGIGQYRAMLPFGRAYYAVGPGLAAAPVSLPSRLASEADMALAGDGRRVPPNVGPLAVHLKAVLTQTPRPLSLEDFDRAMLASGVGVELGELPSPPYAPEVAMLNAVRVVDILPLPGAPRGTLERRAPRGGPTVTCCAQSPG